MPRYYCDYCDNYLTHDSPSVRKQHNSGFKHKANVRAYFLQFEQQQTEDILEQKMAANMAMMSKMSGPGFGGAPGGAVAGLRPSSAMPPAGFRPPASLAPPPTAGAPAAYRPPPSAMPPAGMNPPPRSMPPPGMMQRSAQPMQHY